MGMLAGQLLLEVQKVIVDASMYATKQQRICKGGCRCFVKGGKAELKTVYFADFCVKTIKVLMY